MLTRTFLAVAVVALTCALPGAGQNRPEFGFFLHFDVPPSPGFVHTMQRELAGILPGFSLTWVVSGDAEKETKTYARAFVIRFHGACAAAPTEDDPLSESPFSLAESVVAGGSVLPYTDIYCDRLQAFLRNAEIAPVGEEARLGRAGGRVLAHELYHILLQTCEHSTKGIAKAVYTPSALLSRTLQFEEGELERIGSRYKP